MILAKNRSSLNVKNLILGVGLFFSCVTSAGADPMAEAPKLQQDDSAQTSDISNSDGQSNPLPFKASQVGGAAVSHSLAEYFKISEVMRTEIERFCGNISSRAGDTRSTLQIEKMIQLKKEIEEKIKELEAKRQEYEVWLKKRDNFLEKTKDSLVEIIAKMKPSVAAQQLALVDDYTVASLILKLGPRTSSLIMNELPPQKTAAVTRVLVSAQYVPKKQDQANKQNDPKKNG